MPTISQLPSASAVSAADEIPISQAGVARSASVGTLLAPVQPAIILSSPALLGRNSIGSGGPEQVQVGVGVNLSGGTLVADGLDHSGFPSVSALSVDAELVISNQGSPMLMPASFLRGLFSAGENVAIDPNGVVSAMNGSAVAGTTLSVSGIGDLPILTGLADQDLVPLSHGGSAYAISYSKFLDGITIDQAQAAGPASDSDMLWVAQSSNVMVSQTLRAVWVWVANKLPTYKAPIVEITTSINLDTTLHNGRILVCSQPATLTPLTTDLGSGFQCVVINASLGTVTLGSGFVTSSGSLTLMPWQSATLCCATYSAGTIAFAAMPTGEPTAVVPGQVTGLSASSVAANTIAIFWQSPSSGGAATSYVVQFRLSGTTSWSLTTPVIGSTDYALSGLLPATSYDIMVTALNTSGAGVTSSILTISTAAAAQQAVPPQVIGLVATVASSSSIQLEWAAQSGTSSATSFTVQYRLTGSSSWTFSSSGIIGAGDTISGLAAATSYDFSVVGINAAGSGTASAIITAVTNAAIASVNSITWNLLPSGPYTHGSGAIGINALIIPGSSPVRFGFSTSASSPPSVWTQATLVSTNLWGAYLPTPSTVGTWYTWGEGLDGSGQTVSSGSFQVQ